ncbi:MAG: hypothetical protein ACP5KN_01335, partial [Armatimonadota bacterium]
MAPQTPTDDLAIVRHATARALKAWADPQEGALVETLGFHDPGDGGGALYRIQERSDELEPNEADVLALQNGLAAVLLEREAVNYRMFGAVGDGENDDGVQIKLAHEYANRHAIPVINLSGEFWIKQTNSIPIRTNVRWGHTRFHIDEEFNDRRNPRFEVLSDEPTETLELDGELEQALLEKIRPGVQIIPELAPYAGHLITVRDDEDRIGIRAGYENHRGWAREELFYVEEEGRIIGDIAWEFEDLTSVTATPCSDVYLVIEGGGFYVSGETPNTGSTGYHYNGFSIHRSRTIIREQWVGLEEGASDESLAARSGFYSLRGVYDVTLEDIRLMPWEKSRREPEVAVPHGTYGIGGSRMLYCTFRNLTAEAGWVSWGVFGTNINKNFRIENCRLNRIDVHFHCWNLYIEDCDIGFKGISVTGGGDLFVEDTTRHGNSFISFRPDYGSKWDGRIRLRGCRLRPTGAGTVSVLSYRMRNFDYQYPIGFGRSVAIEDMVIDYSAAPQSEAPCWLMSIVPFSETEAGTRLFFPGLVQFRDVRVEGREQGVRLLRIPDPYHYDLRRPGGYDGSRLDPNCTIAVETVQLERLTPERPGDTANVHLLLGGEEAVEYTDELALYPEIRFSDCDGISAHLENCIASVFLERSSINTVSSPGLRGELAFADCRFQPALQDVDADIYALDSSLGTRFTNCTVHAPLVNGEPRPELVNRIGFFELNGAVRHYHINTALGSRILDHCRDAGIELDPDFIARLKL